MKELRTEIIIEAPKDKVWNAITDFEAYRKWNPFIKEILGSPIKGERLETCMLLEGKVNRFKPVVTELHTEERFEWLGSIPLGLFKGKHYFILEEAAPGHTKLIHGEVFSGLLSKMILKKIGDATHQSFIAMNKALKEYVEG